MKKYAWEWSLEAAYHCQRWVGWVEVIYRNALSGWEAWIARIRKWKQSQMLHETYLNDCLLNWNPDLTGCPVFSLSILERVAGGAAKAAVEAAAGGEVWPEGSARAGHENHWECHWVFCTLIHWLPHWIKREPEPIREVPSCHYQLALFPQYPLLTKPISKGGIFHKARQRRVDWGPRSRCRALPPECLCLIFVFNSPFQFSSSKRPFFP